MAKIKNIVRVLTILMLVMLCTCACSKKNESKEAITEFDENTVNVSRFSELNVQEYNYPKEFALGDNLKGAIEQTSLSFGEFYPQIWDEEYYVEAFTASYLLNSRFRYDYLDLIDNQREGIITKLDAEYIQYSLTGEIIDMTNFCEGDLGNRSNSSSGYGCYILNSYEANDKGDVVELFADMSYYAENSTAEKSYNAYIELVKNPYSCFDGYSIHSIDLTEVEAESEFVKGKDKQEYSFRATFTGESTGNVYVFDNILTEDNLQYAMFVDVDLEDYSDYMADNQNALFFEISYILSEDMEIPIEKVKATKITVVE